MTPITTASDRALHASLAPMRAMAVLVGGTLSLVACGGSETTTGKRVSLQTVATTDTELGMPFTTSVGWKVHLEQAAVAVGSLHYFDGVPAFVRSTRPSRKHWLDRFSTVLEGTAHAHPGHYQAGNALGQMLEPGSVDLFATPVSLGTGEGVTGTYRSARFTFAESPAGLAEETLAGHAAFAAGTATRANEDGAETIHFEVFADYAELAKRVTRGEVEGCELTETEVTGNGTVTLNFKPSIWFDLVDFSEVNPGSADAPTHIEPGDTAQVGFALGLVQLTGYRFSFSP